MPFDRRTIALLTTAEMNQAERLTIVAGTTGRRLMARAGRAVADACQPLLRPTARARVLVLCGPGNNGGDGFVAACALRDAGHDVVVGASTDIASLKGDALAAARDWGGPVAPVEEAEIDAADLVVDALFGAGLSRPLEGAVRDAVDAVNAAGKPVVAVDVPSGVNGDTGQDLGGAVHATTTVTFFRLKPGHLLQPGRSRCGAIVLGDIGIAASALDAIRPRAFQNAEALWRGDFPFPGDSSHKYTRGHAVVLSGAMPTLGAARLAARGAARIGAGLVTVASPGNALAAHAAQLTSIMLRPCDGPEALTDLLADGRKNAVIMGPGLGVGAETRRLVEAALASPAKGEGRGFILDADALTSFSGDARALAALVARASGPVVVTPHDGEFGRLFSAEGNAFRGPSKLERARAGAARLGAVLVLKGDDTIVAAPDGAAAINEGRAPWLATAGSGDVLAGMIGGLVAQRMPVFEAACAAVHLHAAAARSFGPGLISEDIPEALPAVLRLLYSIDGVPEHR